MMLCPQKNLYLPVLPDNSTGKVLFHRNPIKGGTWASVELKKAIDKGLSNNQDTLSLSI